MTRWWRKPSADDRLDLEIRDHIERQVADYIGRGLTEGEARRRVRLEFGGLEQAKEHCRDGDRWATIVGVVKDVRRESLDMTPFLTAYIPARLQSFDLALRVTTGMQALVPLVRRELRSIDPSVPLTQITTARSRLSERLSGRRFQFQVLGLFAAVGLLLAAAGLYAQLAYQVTIRTREIGIRAAIGADRVSIVGMVLARGLRLALAGVSMGIIVAAFAAKLLQGLLYNTDTIEASSYAGAAIGVLLVAATAACLPALRAARLNPIAALREG